MTLSLTVPTSTCPRVFTMAHGESSQPKFRKLVRGDSAGTAGVGGGSTPGGSTSTSKPPVFRKLVREVVDPLGGVGGGRGGGGHLPPAAFRQLVRDSRGPTGRSFPPPPLPTARRSYVPAPVVNVSYTMRPVATVVAASVGRSGAVRFAEPRDDSGARYPSPITRLAGLAAQLGLAASAAAAARPVLGMAELAEAAASGVVISQEEMQRRFLIEQAARLVSVLPLRAVAYACACDVATLFDLGAQRMAAHMIDRRITVWRWSTVKDMHNVWTRMLVWFERHDVVHDGQTFNAVDLGDFFDDVDTRARAKAPANKARAAAADLRTR